MDDRRGTLTQRSVLVIAVLGVGVSGAGCAMMPMEASCPKGQQRHDGQCVPTSSLVFERCLESFRKTRVERAHGVDTEVSAKVRGQGATVRRERKDTEASEYDGLPQEMMSDAIVECRRQEQQQRTLEVERAWAAASEAAQQAHDAKRRAKTAERAQERAEKALARHEEQQAGLEQELEAARVTLAELELDATEQRELLVERHPCTARAWDRCGEQALAAKRSGDHAQAHALYRVSCEGGSIEACGNWGVMFEHGLGVDVDLMEAQRLYEDGCDHGSAHACVNLGFLVEQGRGLRRDPDLAAEYYETACEQGQMRGCGRLGLLVATAAVDIESYPPAAELLSIACDGDYARACLWAGEREIQGRDGERRPQVAARRFRHACEREVPLACVQLGRLHELGDGVTADAGQATELYRRACEQGEARGCAAIERMSRHGEHQRTSQL